MTHILPELPYPTNALEPLYDQATLEVHHGKHHAAYVEKLNKALEGHSELADLSVEELLVDPSALPPNIRQAVINNGGGHANHSLFWKIMGPGKGGEPKGRVRDAILSEFDGFAEFKKRFSSLATELFGSGWTVLSMSRDGELSLANFHNQDSPISKRQKPLLLLDLWEHAYYLKWKNKRAEWIETFWKLIDWDRVESLYAEDPAWMLEHAEGE